MERIIVGLWSALVFFALTCSVSWAQATAQISGTVRDQTGAVLPGVNVTATQTDTGVARMTVTNETGSYVLANLAVGPYRVEAFDTFQYPTWRLHDTLLTWTEPGTEVKTTTKRHKTHWAKQ
jgi:hypothetical protein